MTLVANELVRDVQKLINVNWNIYMAITLAFDVYGTLINTHGIAPQGTEAILIPNEDSDYYTIVPIVGGGNVSAIQKMSDFEQRAYIQLIWYTRDEQRDAIYSLISLPN